jgi:nucleotide-binding universal stress UspA family protein
MEPIRTVLAAVDLTPRSDRVLEAVRRVAPGADVACRVLHVVGDLETLLAVYGGGEALLELQRRIEHEAKGKLQGLAERHFAGLADVGTEVRTGAVWSEIVASAIHHRADLLFLGAHFADQPRDKLQGNVGSKVCRFSPCPVVVVPTAAS